MAEAEEERRASWADFQEEFEARDREKEEDDREDNRPRVDTARMQGEYMEQCSRWAEEDAAAEAKNEEGEEQENEGEENDEGEEQEQENEEAEEDENAEEEEEEEDKDEEEDEEEERGEEGGGFENSHPS